MTAKEYLGQIRHIRVMIAAREEKIQELRVRVVHCTAELSLSPKMRRANGRLSEVVAQICDMERQMVKEQLRLTQKEAELITRIEALDEPVYVQLLTLRYVNCKTWEQIATAMDYNCSWLMRLHKRALAYFEG